MGIDLTILIIFGFVLEVLGVKYGSLVFMAAPTAIVSLLITFIAISRWDLYGLLVIPFMALGTYLGGIWSEIGFISKVYDWRIFISTFIALITMGVNTIFFKRMKTDKVIHSGWIVLLFVIDYLLFTIIQVALYRLFTSGSLFERGEIIYQYYITSTNDLGEEVKELVTKNLCQYGEGGFVYDLFAFGVLIVGTLILRSQGTICNMQKKFIDDRKNAELDRKDQYFTIEDEATEEDESETSNSVSEDEISPDKK